MQRRYQARETAASHPVRGPLHRRWLLHAAAGDTMRAGQDGILRMATAAGSLSQAVATVADDLRAPKGIFVEPVGHPQSGKGGAIRESYYLGGQPISLRSASRH